MVYVFRFFGGRRKRLKLSVYMHLYRWIDMSELNVTHELYDVQDICMIELEQACCTSGRP